MNNDGMKILVLGLVLGLGLAGVGDEVTNLIANGDFSQRENDLPVGWGGWGSNKEGAAMKAVYDEAMPFADGQPVLKITQSCPPDVKKSFRFVSKPFPVEHGKKYKFSVWLKSESPLAVNFTFDGGSGELAQKLGKDYRHWWHRPEGKAQLNEQWKEYSVTTKIPAPGDANYCSEMKRVWIRLEAEKGNGTYWIAKASVLPEVAKAATQGKKPSAVPRQQKSMGELVLSVLKLRLKQVMRFVWGTGGSPRGETSCKYTYFPSDTVGDFKVYVDDLRFVRASWKGVNLLHKWGEIYTPIIWGFHKGTSFKGCTIYEPENIPDPVIAYYVPDVPVRVTRTANGVEYQWSFSYRQADFSKRDLYNLTYPKVTDSTHLKSDVRQMNKLEISKDRLVLTTTIKFLNLPIEKYVHERPPSRKVYFNPVLFPGTGKDRKYLPELRIIGKDCKEINKAGEIKTVTYPKERESKMWMEDEPRSLIFDLEGLGKVRYNFSFSDPEASLLFYQHTGWPTPSLYPYVNPGIVGKIVLPVEKGFKDGSYECTMKMEVLVGDAVTEAPLAETSMASLPLDNCFDVIVASSNASCRYFADEPLKFDIIANGLKSDSQKSLQVNVKVRDYENKIVNFQNQILPAEKQTLRFPQDLKKPLQVTIPSLGKGAFVIEVDLREGRERVGWKAQRFCVIDRPRDYPPEKSFFGGMNGFTRARKEDNLEDIEKTIALVHDLGMKKFRWGDNSITWSAVEKEPGRFVFPSDFIRLKIGIGLGMANFLSCGSFEGGGSFVPEWARSGKKTLYNCDLPKDFKDYENYCYQVANRFKGLIDEFELENEPNYVRPENAAQAQEYFAQKAKILSTAYRGIKRAQSNAVVIAGTIGIGGPDLKDLKWFDDLLSYAQSKGLTMMDVMAPHYLMRPAPYPEDAIDTLNYAKDIAKRYNLILWNGEDGRSLVVPNSFYNIYPNSTFLKMEKGYANISIREHLVQKASGVQHVNLCWTIGWKPPRGMHCFEYESTQAGDFFGMGGFIKPHAVAYSALAHLIEGADFDQRIDLKFKDAWAVVFKRADITTAALWLKEDLGSLDIELPEGTEHVNIVGSNRKMAGKQKLAMSDEPFYLTINTEHSDKLIEALKKSRFTPDKLLELGKIDFTDDKKDIQVLVKNFSVDEVKVQSMTLKYGQTELTLNDVILAPDKETAVAFTPKEEIKSSMLAEVVASVGGKEYKKEEFVFYSSLQSAKSMGYLVAVKAKGPVTVDGDLSEWQDAVPIMLNRKEQVGYWDLKPLDIGGWRGEDDLSAVGYLMWDDQNLYFACRVKDDVYANAFPDGISSTWNCDSIQMVFDPLMDNAEYEKCNKDDQVINLSLNQKGPAYWRMTFWSDAKGNPYPGKVTVLPDGQITGAKLVVKKVDKGMIYEFSMPLKELYPLEVKPGSIFRFNFIVNDDDGNGRKQWIGITLGIGETKAPYLYKKVYLAE